MTDRPRRRQWVSEDAVLAELERLGELSMETVAEYAVHSQEAARAEAAYKSLRARTILRSKATAKAGGSRGSVAEAEVEADAADDVAAAYLLRLTTAAMAETDREALRTIRTNQEALRTAAASARDGVVGPGWKGKP